MCRRSYSRERIDVYWPRILVERNGKKKKIDEYVFVPEEKSNKSSDIYRKKWGTKRKANINIDSER